jgi:gluconolactonase
MYWIDSATNDIDVFDFDAASGSLRNRRTAVHCPKLGSDGTDGVAGIPDGMTIDATGTLWVVLGESGHVVSYDAHTGRQLAAVALPVKRPTACTFGDSDLSGLYVTTREEGATGTVSAGGLFRVRIPGVRGLAAAYEFAG